MPAAHNAQAGGLGASPQFPWPRNIGVILMAMLAPSRKEKGNWERHGAKAEDEGKSPGGVVDQKGIRALLLQSLDVGISSSVGEQT